MGPVDPHRLSDRELAITTYSKLAELQHSIEGLLTKVFLGLLAIAGATIGVRFIGSPPYTVVAGYAGWGASVFLAGATLCTWRRITWWARIVRVVLTAFMLTSTITRTFVYHAGEEVAPQWFPVVIDLFFIVIAVVLSLSVAHSWDHPAPRKQE